MNATRFAPQLILKNVQQGMEFYKNAFGATELRRWTNPDGTVHVAEMAIDDALFHLHEEVQRTKEFSPQTLDGVTVVVGLFTKDPDSLVSRAVAAGAVTMSPIQDFDYGYRQGSLRDPFGHYWLIEKEIP